ncbi:hypothetical protein AB1N83_014100 [Pleurotus pulmonarius]
MEVEGKKGMPPSRGRVAPSTPDASVAFPLHRQLISPWAGSSFYVGLKAGSVSYKAATLLQVILTVLGASRRYIRSPASGDPSAAHNLYTLPAGNPLGFKCQWSLTQYSYFTMAACHPLALHLFSTIRPWHPSVSCTTSTAATNGASICHI